MALTGLVGLVIVQSRTGFNGVGARALDAVDGVEAWLRSPPLSLSDVQLGDWAQRAVSWADAQAATIASGALAVGSQVAEVFAGTLLTLFSLIFCCSTGAGSGGGSSGCCRSVLARRWSMPVRRAGAL